MEKATQRDAMDFWFAEELAMPRGLPGRMIQEGGEIMQLRTMAAACEHQCQLAGAKLDFECKSDGLIDRPEGAEVGVQADEA